MAKDVTPIHPGYRLRYDWEALMRRVIFPKPADITDETERKRTPKPAAVKHVALTAATYANPDGSNIRPGVPRLVDDTDLSETTVKRCLAVLERTGLLKCLRRGGKNGRREWASVYQLVIPVDLLERVEIRPLASEQGSPATSVQPVDNTDQGSPATSDHDADETEQRSPATCGYPDQRSLATGSEVAGDPPPSHDHSITPTKPISGSVSASSPLGTAVDNQNRISAGPSGPAADAPEPTNVVVFPTASRFEAGADLAARNAARAAEAMAGVEAAKAARRTAQPAGEVTTA